MDQIEPLRQSALRNDARQKPGPHLIATVELERGLQGSLMGPPQPTGEATVDLERLPKTLAQQRLQVDHLRAQGVDGAVGHRLIHGSPRENGQIPSQALQL